MIMAAHSACASRYMMRFAFSLVIRLTRAQGTLTPEIRDAHQQMVMRVPTRRRMVPSGTLDPKTAVGIVAVIDRVLFGCPVLENTEVKT